MFERVDKLKPEAKDLLLSELGEAMLNINQLINSSGRWKGKPISDQAKWRRLMNLAAGVFAKFESYDEADIILDKIRKGKPITPGEFERVKTKTEGCENFIRVANAKTLIDDNYVKNPEYDEEPEDKQRKFDNLFDGIIIGDNKENGLDGVELAEITTTGEPTADWLPGNIVITVDQDSYDKWTENYPPFIFKRLDQDKTKSMTLVSSDAQYQPMVRNGGRCLNMTVKCAACVVDKIKKVFDGNVPEAFEPELVLCGNTDDVFYIAVPYVSGKKICYKRPKNSRAKPFYNDEINSLGFPIIDYKLLSEAQNKTDIGTVCYKYVSDMIKGNKVITVDTIKKHFTFLKYEIKTIPCDVLDAKK